MPNSFTQHSFVVAQPLSGLYTHTSLYFNICLPASMWQERMNQSAARDTHMQPLMRVPPPLQTQTHSRKHTHTMSQRCVRQIHSTPGHGLKTKWKWYEGRYSVFVGVTASFVYCCEQKKRGEKKEENGKINSKHTHMHRDRQEIVAQHAAPSWYYCTLHNMDQ